MIAKRGGMLFAVVVVLVGVPYAAVTAWKPARPPFNRETCSLIRKGMSRAEVEKILGGPPGVYTIGKFSSQAGYAREMASEFWFGDDGEILVAFDRAGIVYDADFREYLTFHRPTFLERVRTFLRL